VAACAALVLPAPPLQAQETTTKGEVTKIDRAGGRVTLKHGEIKNLDMPPMTMIYQVRQPSLLEGLAVGDRVRFTAERVDGRYTIVTLHKAP
jgi:Cu(I)/Ag(I) efflux system periplasmic protein CusF